MVRLTQHIQGSRLGVINATVNDVERYGHRH